MQRIFYFSLCEGVTFVDKNTFGSKGNVGIVSPSRIMRRKYFVRHFRLTRPTQKDSIESLKTQDRTSAYCR